MGDRGSRDGRFKNFNLFRVYKTHKDSFIEWVGSKYSQGYFDEVCSALDKIFCDDRKYIDQIKEFVCNSKNVASRSSSVAFRVFLNFCDFKELLDIEQLNFFRNKIKIHVNKSIDTYVPKKEEIDKTLNYIIENYPQYEFLYRFLLESGCRITELKNFIETFDENKIEVYGDIVTYSNFYLRGQKSSYYLFFTKKTFDMFKPGMFVNRNIEHIKDIIKHRKLLPLKYLRKYQFTLMIQNDISFEIANFIQGRTSQNIGFNHYLAKKEIALREYGKIIN